MYHAPMPYDYNDLLRRRKLAEMEKKIKEMKIPRTEDKTKVKRPITKDKTKDIVKIAKQIIDVLPESTEERKKKGDTSTPTARFKLPAEFYSAHKQYIEEFNINHPDVTPTDILAAEASQAAYIENSDVMTEYVENVSSLGKKGFQYSPKHSNEYMSTFVNSQKEAIVAYRGTVTWVGEDGRANLANTLKVTKAKQFITDSTGAEVRTGKAQLIDTMENNILADNLKVIMTTGHSQGGFNASEAQKNKFTDATVRNFNPAPGGSVAAENGKVFVTPNDAVSIGSKSRQSLFNDMNLITVKSIENTPLNRLTGGHMQGNFAADTPGLLEVNPGFEMTDTNLLKPPSKNVITEEPEIEIKPPAIDTPKFNFPDRIDEFGSLEDTIKPEGKASSKSTPRVSEIIGLVWQLDWEQALL